ncbi:MAG: NADH-quinone oxidoreductase subunit J [Maricaulaceae bacterium]
MLAVTFYVLAGITVGAAFGVVSARNPVHSVMFLILTFFSTAGLFVILGAEYLAMLLVMVYVGAVAVLFLFVVMMLDVDFVSLRQGFLNYLPLGVLVAGLLAVELALVGATWVQGREVTPHPVPADAESVSNIAALGAVLYDDYVFVFQAAGLVLLVAMIGAVVLTLREREGVKRQDVGAQVARTAEQGVSLVDVKPGRGVSTP